MHEFTDRIRWFINDRRKQQALLEQSWKWSQVCSSLDVIGDTELAIESYLSQEFPPESGSMYLVLYGLLQALILQQDAVNHLCEALDFGESIWNYRGLNEIRNIRIDTAGHPTKRGNDKGKSYHHISRITLGPGGYQLISFYSDGQMKVRNVNIPKLVEDQKEILSQILRNVINHLEAEMAAHKEKFRDEKLADCFTHVWSWHISKISEGTYKVDKSHAIWADESLHSIKEMLNGFREVLAKRDIDLDTYDSIKYLYEEMEYPLAELEAFFKAVREGRNPNIDPKAVYIFTWYVRAKIGELTEIAGKIDEDYAS